VKADSDYNYLTKFNSITPYYTESTSHRLTARPSGPVNYTQRDSSTAPHRLYTVKTRPRHKKPIPHRTPCATGTDHHTWRRHHLTHVSTKLSPTHRTHSPSPHLTPHYLYIPYGLQNRHSPWENRLTGVTLPESRKLTFQPTTPPDFRNSAPPATPGTLVHHQII